MRLAVRSVVWGVIVMGFVWFLLRLYDPTGIASTVIPLANLVFVVALTGIGYRQVPWLVRTSYHGIDLFADGAVRLPWMAITSIYVSGEKLIVTVGDPATPQNLLRPDLNGRLWARTTFQVVTPEITDVLADLAIRLPHIEVQRR